MHERDFNFSCILSSDTSISTCLYRLLCPALILMPDFEVSKKSDKSWITVLFAFPSTGGSFTETLRTSHSRDFWRVIDSFFDQGLTRRVSFMLVMLLIIEPSARIILNIRSYSITFITVSDDSVVIRSLPGKSQFWKLLVDFFGWKCFESSHDFR